ncbi:hypothetical protein [Trinickia diaoshuihuensis]|uniref:hypothetical protein n=1 Tax=Trinickia diaoshuihuensis TaxID=2292265 RepID=UPI0013C2B21E|nr:hypothetical protein [Trinickia diaoshuihuensis]
MFTRRDVLKGTLAGIGTLLLYRYATTQAALTLPPQAGTADESLTQSGKDFFLDAIDISLDQSHIPGDGALTVRADTIRIDGLISLPGRDLTILARQIVCGANATISTKAPAVAVDYAGATAPNGVRSGDPGQDGRNGSDGANGGQVLIFAENMSGNLTVDASGAQGGAAENGGDGAPGAHGRDWARGMAQGGDGGVGGRAGAPGKPGNGGNGGRIGVYVVGTITVLPKPILVSRGGGAGTPASPGKPGAGGQAGNGGRYWPVHVHVCGQR